MSFVGPFQLRIFWEYVCFLIPVSFISSIFLSQVWLLERVISFNDNLFCGLSTSWCFSACLDNITVFLSVTSQAETSPPGWHNEMPTAFPPYTAVQEPISPLGVVLALCDYQCSKAGHTNPFTTGCHTQWHTRTVSSAEKDCISSSLKSISSHIVLQTWLVTLHSTFTLTVWVSDHSLGCEMAQDMAKSPGCIPAAFPECPAPLR